MSHTKETYLAARFRRLAARKGKKRAIVAVAHTILVSLYHMLKTKQPYRELGADFLDRRHAAKLKRYLLKRLERLGVVVTIQSVESTAVSRLELYFQREIPFLIPQPGQLHFPSSPPGRSQPQSQTTVPRMVLVQFLDESERAYAATSRSGSQHCLPYLRSSRCEDSVPRRQIDPFLIWWTNSIPEMGNGA